MALITLKTWAEQVGINPASARQKAGRGTLPVVKMGRDWFIEEDTPNTDARVKSGEYKGWRKKALTNKNKME